MSHTLRRIEDSAAGSAEQWRAIARRFLTASDRAAGSGDDRSAHSHRRWAVRAFREARRSERQRRQARQLRAGE